MSTPTEPTTPQPKPADAAGLRCKVIAIRICDPCLRGEGQECHTPECSRFLHKVDLPTHVGLWQELPDDFDINDYTKRPLPTPHAAEAGVRAEYTVDSLRATISALMAEEEGGKDRRHLDAVLTSLLTQPRPALEQAREAGDEKPSWTEIGAWNDLLRKLKEMKARWRTERLELKDTSPSASFAYMNCAEEVSAALAALNAVLPPAKGGAQG